MFILNPLTKKKDYLSSLNVEMVCFYTWNCVSNPGLVGSNRLSASI